MYGTGDGGLYAARVTGPRRRGVAEACSFPPNCPAARVGRIGSSPQQVFDSEDSVHLAALGAELKRISGLG